MALKKIYKTILVVTGKIIFLCFALLSLAFVNHEYKRKTVEVVNIKIHSQNQPALCSVEEVEKMMRINHLELEHKSYRELNFHKIEEIINEGNEIKYSNIYFTVDKQLYIEVTERKPIARLLSGGINHYIDEEWKLFPVSIAYKVPLIVGEFYENTEIYKKYSIKNCLKSKALSEISALDDVYIVLQNVLSDTFLLNFIDYTYIDKNQGITIYPVVGKFKIDVGSSEYFHEKMNKLKLFLKEGLNKNDGWNKYSEINLKFKYLIYCTKK